MMNAALAPHQNALQHAAPLNHELNHASPGAGDRAFYHLVCFAGLVHCIEVHRQNNLYRGRIVLAIDRLLIEPMGDHWPQRPEAGLFISPGSPPRTARQSLATEVAAAGQVIAISRGVGFSSLREAFRSLRKDSEINQMAQTLSQAVLRQKPRMQQDKPH